MMLPDGALAYEGEFKTQPSAVFNGYFSVLNAKGNLSLFEADGKKTREVPGCSNLFACGVMSEKLIPVTPKGGRIKLIDGEGAVKATLEPVGGKEVVACYQMVTDGMLLVILEDGGVGYLDKTGKVAIKPIYTDGTFFQHGHAIVTKQSEKENRRMVIDKEGTIVLKFKESWELAYNALACDRVVVKVGDRFALVAIDGTETKLPTKVKEVIRVTGENLIYKTDDDLYGVCDLKGQIVVNSKYKELFELDGDFIAKIDDSSDFIRIDAKGEVKTRFDFKEIDMSAKAFGIFAKEGSTYTLYDIDGKAKSKAEIFNVGKHFGADEYVVTNYGNLTGKRGSSILEDESGDEEDRVVEVEGGVAGAMGKAVESYSSALQAVLSNHSNHITLTGVMGESPVVMSLDIDPLSGEVTGSYYNKNNGSGDKFYLDGSIDYPGTSAGIGMSLSEVLIGGTANYTGILRVSSDGSGLLDYSGTGESTYGAIFDFSLKGK